MTTANPKDSIGLNVVRNEMKILAEQCTHVYGLEVTCIFEVKKNQKIIFWINILDALIRSKREKKMMETFLDVGGNPIL